MDKESLRLTELLESVRAAQDEKLSELSEQLSQKARNEAELEARLHGEETKRKNLEREVESLTENRLSDDNRRREVGDELHNSKAFWFLILVFSTFQGPLTLLMAQWVDMKAEKVTY